MIRHTAVGLFLLLVRRSGTHCLKTCGIRSVLWTVADSHWRHFHFRSTSMFSALEVCYENALYKFTFDVDIDIIRCRNMSVKSPYKGAVHPVHVMNAEQRQTAADPWTKPTYLSHWPTCRLLGNYTHHHHLLLLIPKADTHFTIPQRVEGWVDLDGWLHTQTVFLPASSHPSK